MYTSRSPVPSKAALQILRQLAYISSGTVCGAAALVAEERRRQTCIAKKIVENSRRIKQHPRYAHGAAAAALQEADYAFCNDEISERTHDVKRRRGNDEGQIRAGREISGGEGRLREPDLQLAPRNNVLPSEVDKGYRRIALRENQHSTRKSSHSHDSSDGHLGSRPEKARSKDGMTSQNKPQSVLEGKSWKDQIYTKVAHDIGQRSFDRAIRRLDLVKTSGALDNLTEPMAHQVLATKLSMDSAPHPQTIRNATRMFLVLHPLPTNRRPATRTLVAFVTDLLDRAANQGQSEAAFSLLGWLDAHNDLREEHVGCVIERAEGLLGNIATDSSIHSGLSDDFRLLAISRQNEMPLKAIAVIFSNLSQARTLDRTHVQLLQSFSKSSGYPDLLQPLSAVCSHLVYDGSFKAAVDLFQLCESSVLDPHELTPLAGRLLDIRADSTDPQDSRPLLAFLDSMGESLSNHLERLLEGANAAKRLADVVDFCQDFLPCHTLSANSYRLFFMGLSKSRHVKSAPLFLSQLPLPLDSDVLTASQLEWSRILRRQMTETGNFSLVFGTFQSMRKLAGANKLSMPVYNTMIRICMQSGQDEKAQQILRLLCEEDGLSPDIDTFMSWLLGRAKNEDWDGVQRYLNVLREDAFDTIDPKERAHLLHPLVALYAKRHDSSEVWSFTNQLFSKHGASMHRATFSIVFKALIRDKKPDRIVEWFAFVRKQGLEVDLLESDAIDAFREYYYVWQPISQTFSHLVRRVAYECPHLLSRELLLLNINAVGQDIRHEVGYGKRVGTRQAHVEERYALQGRLAQMSFKGSSDYAGSAPEESTVLDNKLEATPDVVSSAEKAEMLRIDSGIGTETVVPKSEASVLTVPISSQSSTITNQTTFRERKKDLHYERRLLKSKMLFELTIDDPEEALKTYQQSLSATGLPISSVSLDIAVEAGLAVKQGGRELADDIIRHAQIASMDTTSTMTTLMVHHFKNLKRDGEDTLANVDGLVANILKFYRTMLEKNIPLTHHVSVTAARTLIRFGYPKKAIHLLRQIYFASQSYRASFDIVTYTVFLKAYVACGNEKGAAWVIRQILNRNIHIDRKFLLGLKQNVALLRSKRNPVHDGVKRQHFISTLRQWVGECGERRKSQVHETRLLGNRMVDALVACSKPDPGRTVLVGEQNRPLRIRQMHVFPNRPSERSVRFELLAAKRARRSWRLQRLRPMKTAKQRRRLEMRDAELNAPQIIDVDFSKRDMSPHQ